MTEKATDETIEAIFTELARAGVLIRGPMTDVLTRRSISRGLDGVSQAPVAEGELLPCPFCGGEPDFHRIDNDEDENFGAHFIQCSNPMCSVSSVLRWGDKCDPKPLLAEAWNTRTPAPTKEPAGSPDVAALVATLPTLADLQENGPYVSLKTNREALRKAASDLEALSGSTAADVIRAAVEETRIEDRYHYSITQGKPVYQGSGMSVEQARLHRRAAVRRHTAGE